MATRALTEADFESTVTGDGIVFVDFWADWCGPCKMFAPTFEAASEAHPDVVFGKIDTEDQQQLAAELQIQSIPTLMVFRQGVLLYREAGALPGPMLGDLIKQVKGLDMDEVRKELAAAAAEDATEGALEAANRDEI